MSSIFRCPCWYVDMNEQAKLNHSMNFLTDKALSWATALWQGSDNITSYDSFLTLFQGPKWAIIFPKGHRWAVEYASDFRTLATESSCNDAAVRTVYRQGLNVGILRELACRDDSGSLDTCIHLSINLENLLREQFPRKEDRSNSVATLIPCRRTLN